MTPAVLTLNDIAQMTFLVGEGWAVAHARRLIELVRRIGVGLPYDVPVVEFASYLHDWGAFPRYILAEGDYRAIARNEGKVYERGFKVITGVDGEIEVMAR